MAGYSLIINENKTKGMTFFYGSLHANANWRKLIKATKVILLFLGIVIQLQAAAFSQNTFTLSEKNITVKEALKKIEKSSNYTIFYRNDQVNLNNLVSITAENAKLEEVLQQILAGQPLTFEVLDNNMIVIKASNEKLGSRQVAITGIVTDERNQPLIGAGVVVKGTRQGASTDVNGKFTINVSSNSPVTLEIKFLGYLTKEVKVTSGQKLGIIRLDPDAATLEDVVVVGFGVVKKRDLTGSVASVKSEDITRVPTANAIDAIQGRIPGADIVRSSGAPGAGTTVTIRGTKSIANRDDLASRNSPLYIIDGYQGGDISTLSPNDIESIDVLKDASSTAIYGAQGANGVVIVTTKKGASGKTKVSYNGFYGTNGNIFPELRVGDAYYQFRKEAGRKRLFDGQTVGVWESTANDLALFPEQGEAEAYSAGQWIDWYDLVTKTGQQQNHSVTVSGGSDKTRFMASLGYFNETGSLRNADFNRYTTRLNLDHNVAKWVKIGLLTQLTYSKQNVRNNPLNQAMSAVPLGTPFDANGVVDLYPLIDGAAGNISPLADEKSANVARDQRLATNVLANGFIELTPVPGLTIRSSLGTNFTFNRNGVFNDKESLARYTTNLSLASVTNNFNRFLNWDNVVTYNKNIKDHSFTISGITSYLQSDADQTFALGYNQVLSSQLFYNLAGTDPSSRNISSNYTGWNNMAFAGRLNYSYKNRYLLTVSGRSDGSSRLSKGRKWDFFPSAALAWNASDEEFFSKLKPTFSNLKLRLSYGVSGNYNIQPYGTQSTLTTTRTSFGDVAAPGYTFEGTVANANLGWEKSASTDLGIDMGFFNNRLTATVDLYSTVTSDILLPRDLPLSSGVTRIYENIGETKNKGIELSITSTNIQNKNFRWSSTVTFSANKERISKLVNDRDIIAVSGTEINSLLLGRPVNSFYTYTKQGIWQTSEAAEAAKYKVGSHTFEPGDIKLADLNGDNTFDAKDYGYVGSTVPKWVAGFQNNISYKNFDLNLFFVARYGQTINAEFLGRYNPSGTGNNFEYFNFWTPENPSNDFPRPRWGAPLSSYVGYQAINFVDGSYIKLRNVTLGYSLPSNVAKKIGAGKVRIYATGSNLFTITRSHLLKNYDPERGGSLDYPLTRQFVFGLNLDF